MFLRIQDFNLAQIWSDLPKFQPNFYSVLPISNQICSKSNQFCPNLINFAQQLFLLEVAAAFSAPTALITMPSAFYVWFKNKLRTIDAKNPHKFGNKQPQQRFTTHIKSVKKYLTFFLSKKIP